MTLRIPQLLPIPALYQVPVHRHGCLYCGKSVPCPGPGICNAEPDEHLTCDECLGVKAEVSYEKS